MNTVDGLRGYSALTPGVSRGGLAIVVVLHAALLAALWSMNVIKIPPEFTTLMVRVIQPEPPKPPEVTPPKPQPVAKQPAPQPQPQVQEPPPPPTVLAATTGGASPAGVAAPPREAPPPAPPAPPPAPLVEPRFDADYLDNPAPVYPAMSRRMEETGKTVLRVYVEPSGKPSQVQVKSSSGSPRLDQAAQDAVWRWKFVPARRGAEAVAAWVLVPIVFNL